MQCPALLPIAAVLLAIFSAGCIALLAWELTREAEREGEKSDNPDILPDRLMNPHLNGGKPYGVRGQAAFHDLVHDPRDDGSGRLLRPAPHPSAHGQSQRTCPTS